MPSAAPVTAVPSSALALAFSFAIKRILRERVSRMPPGLIWMDGRRSTGLMPSHESAPARTRHRRCSAKTSQSFQVLANLGKSRISRPYTCCCTDRVGTAAPDRLPAPGAEAETSPTLSLSHRAAFEAHRRAEPW